MKIIFTGLLAMIAGAAIFWGGYSNLLPNESLTTMITSTSDEFTTEKLGSKNTIERLANTETNSNKNLENKVAQLYQEMSKVKTKLADFEMLLKTSGVSFTQPDQSPPAQTETDFEAEFVAEVTDQTWSKQATDDFFELTQTMESEGLFIDQIECRSSQCRVEIWQDDPIELQTRLSQLIVNIAESFPNVTIKPLGDEDEKLVLFLSSGDAI